MKYSSCLLYIYYMYIDTHTLTPQKNIKGRYMAAVYIGFLIFIIFFYSRIHVIISLTHHGDAEVLQTLKNSWQNTPANWNQSDDPCGLPWKGVKCNSDSRVIQLTLTCSFDDQLNRFSPTTTSLKGKLGGVIGDLTELKTLDLSCNQYLTGPLPPQLGNLSNLNRLDLCDCSFTGSIPDELGNLTQLSILDLSQNKLSGKIPPSLGKLSNLVELALMDNQFSGEIPVSTGKTPGLDLLLKADFINLSSNKYLTGPLPPQLGNLRNLNQLTLSDCNFTGSIPDELGNLTQLSELHLGGNKLSGKIPLSLGKLSKLIDLELSQNQLSGQLPVSSGKTPGLDLLLKVYHLSLNDNNLSGSIPSKLFSPNMRLWNLLLSGNQFKGKIPDSLGLVRTLESVRLNNNALSGEIPSTISNLRHLQELNLAHNKLSGALPDLSKMASLQHLSLSNNAFDAAEAPTWFSTLPSLAYLEMEYGSLQGPVPTKLFSLPKTERVKLGNNAFNGTLTIIGANISSQLRVVDLQNNKISAVTFDSNSIALMLAGNPICADDFPNKNYCH